MRKPAFQPNHSLSSIHPPHAAAGFSLLEMAVVLVIIGLLLAGTLLPMSAQVDNRRTQETQQQIDEITQALVGFAVANGRLPCPADPTKATGAANAGTEDLGAGTCNRTSGAVPWATLGVAETDAWGRRFTYAVTGTFAQTIANAIATLPTWTAGTAYSLNTLVRPTTANGHYYLCQSAGTSSTTEPTSWPTDGTTVTDYTVTWKDMGTTMQAAFTLGSPGNYNVRATVGGNIIANQIPAVIVSHGKNGLGAYSQDGGQLALSSDVDEIENSNANADFVSKSPTATFDDLVGWLSANTLFSRMVAARKLP
ncbi:MAG: type II secretion system protein [Sulfuricellaceae bacterium]|jgi:prepilin-type N-terminal cleavage/methylation domain-containing protein